MRLALHLEYHHVRAGSLIQTLHHLILHQVENYTYKFYLDLYISHPTDKEDDGDEETHGHKRKRKQSKSPVSDKGK